jgi:hypothetical protein
MLSFQLDVPVRAVYPSEEGSPLSIAGAGQRPRHKRGPRRAARLPAQPHAGLPRSAPSLQAVTLEASAHDVLPCRHSASRAGNHVVQVELATRLPLTAVLAGISVAHEDVVATEPDLAPRHPVKRHQQDHARHAHEARYEAHGLRVERRHCGPIGEIKGSVLLVYCPCDAPVQKRERPPNRRHVDRQIRTVQDEGLSPQISNDERGRGHLTRRLPASDEQSR